MTRRRLLCTLGYPSSCLCVRGVQLLDLVTTKCLFSRMNCEHHAVDLTCKSVAAQVTNEVGERLKIALGLTAVLDVGGHARCSHPSIVAL